MAASDFYSLVRADSNGIAVVEQTAGTAPNGAPEGTVHVTLDGSSASATVATTDSGPSWTVTRTVTTSSDMTTPAAISPAPTAGQKLVGDDFIISTDTAMSFTIQEETSGTVFCVIYLPANGTAVITTRDGLKTAVINRKFFGVASVPGNISVTAMSHSAA